MTKKINPTKKELRAFRDSDIFFMRIKEKRSISDLAVIFDLSNTCIHTIIKKQLKKSRLQQLRDVELKLHRED
jgi:Mor family transcriptional regulator